MTKPEDLFHQIAKEIPDSIEGKMFGALCIKASNGKAGVMFQKDNMIFKLDNVHLKETLELKGSQLFDPAGGRPMKEWVQVPFTHNEKWKELADISMELVKRIKK